MQMQYSIAFFHSLSACCLPGLPAQIFLPHSQLRLCLITKLTDCHLYGLLTIVNKVQNFANLVLCCSRVHSQTLILRVGLKKIIFDKAHN